MAKSINSRLQIRSACDWYYSWFTQEAFQWPQMYESICNWTITGPASGLISANSLMDTGEKSHREQGRFKLFIGPTNPNPDMNLNCHLLSETGANLWGTSLHCDHPLCLNYKAWMLLQVWIFRLQSLTFNTFSVHLGQRRFFPLT